MWVHEYSAGKAISPEVIWAVLSEAELGPEITADFPEAMDGLLACAAAQSSV